MGICSCNKESNSVSNTSFRSQASSGYCGSEFTDSSRCNTTPNSDGSGRFIGSKSISTSMLLSLYGKDDENITHDHQTFDVLSYEGLPNYIIYKEEAL